MSTGSGLGAGPQPTAPFTQNHSQGIKFMTYDALNVGIDAWLTLRLVLFQPAIQF